jgi:hypothetical protein
MPTLIVEDGTGVENANTYVDLAYLQSYADNRGLTLPTQQADKEIYLLRAMDYLESRRGDFQGLKAVEGQLLQWPRKDVHVDCQDLAVDSIPEELKKAQCQLVVEQQQRTRLYPAPRTSSVEGLVTHKQVGPLTKKFAFDGKATADPSKGVIIASVEIFLHPLTIKGSCCNGPYKKTIRI